MEFASITKRSFVEYRRPDRTDLDRDTRPIRSREDFRRNYFAFTSVAAGPGGRLFCGMTNFAGDLLYAYDPSARTFESLGYSAVAEPHEVKIHRGLCVGGDGVVYGATSCLSPINELAGAPGGKVFRFDPGKRTYDVLGQPVPGMYIQTISLDDRREMVYGACIPALEFFALRLSDRAVVYRQFMESIAHVGAIDDDGGYWGTWLSRGRHLLFRYDPGDNAVRFFDHGFPTPCRSLMYAGAGPIDSMINGGDGFLYVGHESGELYRIAPGTGEVEYLCKPLAGHRMPALTAGPNGLLLGVGGNDRAVGAFAYDRRSGRYEQLGPLHDPAADAGCFRPHDCCLMGDTLYVGETDHPERSCYLWECRLG